MEIIFIIFLVIILFLQVILFVGLRRLNAKVNMILDRIMESQQDQNTPSEATE